MHKSFKLEYENKKIYEERTREREREREREEKLSIFLDIVT